MALNSLTAAAREVTKSRPSVAMDVSAVRAKLENLIALARLLQRLEGGALRISAGQYRQLIGQLQKALADPMPADALGVILDAHPAASEVYENLHYEHA